MRNWVERKSSMKKGVCMVKVQGYADENEDVLHKKRTSEIRGGLLIGFDIFAIDRIILGFDGLNGKINLYGWVYPSG